MQRYACERPDKVAACAEEEEDWLVAGLAALLEDAVMDAAKHGWKQVCIRSRRWTITRASLPMSEARDPLHSVQER